MAIEFTEGTGLGFKLTDIEKDLFSDELVLLEDHFKTSGQLFKLKAAELINTLEKRKMTTEQIVSVLLDDFDNDGVLFGGLKRGFKSGGVDFVRNVESQANFQEWQKLGYDEMETWIAVLVNTCPDCLPRHGVKHKHSAWESMGLPGSGWSVCGSKCQCQLMPSSITESKAELRDPIKRVKGEIRKVAKEKNVKNIKNYVNRKLGSINNTADPIRKTYRKLLSGFKR